MIPCFSTKLSGILMSTRKTRVCAIDMMDMLIALQKIELNDVQNWMSCMIINEIATITAFRVECVMFGR